MEGEELRSSPRGASDRPDPGDPFAVWRLPPVPAEAAGVRPAEPSPRVGVRQLRVVLAAVGVVLLVGTGAALVATLGGDRTSASSNASADVGTRADGSAPPSPSAPSATRTAPGDSGASDSGSSDGGPGGDGAAATGTVGPPSAATSPLAGGEPRSPQEFPRSAAPERHYDESIRASYLNACNRSSEGSQNYCLCTLRELENRYTEEEYLRFNAAVDSAESRQIVKDIYAACSHLRHTEVI